MNTTDQDTVLRAIEDARRILGEYIAPGPHDATRTVHRLIAVLDRDEVVLALDRMAPNPSPCGIDRGAPGAAIDPGGLASRTGPSPWLRPRAS